MISLFQRGSKVPGYKNKLSTNMCSPPDKFTSKLHVDCDSPIACGEESKIINADTCDRLGIAIVKYYRRGGRFSETGEDPSSNCSYQKMHSSEAAWNGMQSTECNVARPRRIARDIMVVPRPGKKADGNDERRRNEKLRRYSERCSMR